MKKRLLAGLLLPILAICQADGDSSAPEQGLAIHVVDEYGNDFPVQTVRWWHAGHLETRQPLACDQPQCSEWFLGETVVGQVVVRADASIVKEDDDRCWDLYAGETTIQMPSVDMTIVMAFTNIVCS